MKFTVAAIVAFAAVAAAQTSLTPEQQCAAKCDLKDICCKAICFNVPCPSNQDADKTTQCAAKCPTNQGPEVFARCQQGCIKDYFYTPGGTPTGAHPDTSSPAGATQTSSSSGSSPTTTGSSSGSATGSGSQTSPTGSSSGSGSSPSATSSGSGSRPTQSGAASSNYKVQLGSAAGAIGLLAAAFAL